MKGLGNQVNYWIICVSIMLSLSVSDEKFTCNKCGKIYKSKCFLTNHAKHCKSDNEKKLVCEKFQKISNAHQFVEANIDFDKINQKTSVPLVPMF